MRGRGPMEQRERTADCVARHLPRCDESPNPARALPRVPPVHEPDQALHERPRALAALDRVGKKWRDARLHPAVQTVLRDGLEVREAAEAFGAGEAEGVAACLCATKGKGLVQVEDCAKERAKAVSEQAAKLERERTDRQSLRGALRVSAVFRLPKRVRRGTHRSSTPCRIRARPSRSGTPSGCARRRPRRGRTASRWPARWPRRASRTA